jgi:predicted tellurium resistance membrane protein TerC
VGGAAHGDMRLLIFGLALSIPLVLFGSSFLTNVLRKWPVLGYVGSAVLTWTAGRMIVHDKVVHDWLAQANLPMLDNLLPSLGVTVVLGLGYWANMRMRKQALVAGTPESVEPAAH